MRSDFFDGRLRVACLELLSSLVVVVNRAFFPCGVSGLLRSDIWNPRIRSLTEAALPILTATANLLCRIHVSLWLSVYFLASNPFIFF